VRKVVEKLSIKCLKVVKKRVSKNHQKNNLKRVEEEEEEEEEEGEGEGGEEEEGDL
jgi:hypothetical protein